MVVDFQTDGQDVLSVHDRSHAQIYTLSGKAGYLRIDVGSLFDKEVSCHQILQQTYAQARSGVSLAVLVDNGWYESVPAFGPDRIEYGGTARGLGYGEVVPVSLLSCEELGLFEPILFRFVIRVIGLSHAVEQRHLLAEECHRIGLGRLGLSSWRCVRLPVDVSESLP